MDFRSLTPASFHRGLSSTVRVHALLVGAPDPEGDPAGDVVEDHGDAGADRVEARVRADREVAAAMSKPTPLTETCSS
jgi:hypothetical protein